MKVFLRIFGFCLLMAVTGLVAGYMWLTSVRGLGWAQGMANGVEGVQVGALLREGRHIVAREIVLSDRDGAYARVGEVRVALAPAAALRGVVRLRDLHVQDVDWMRRPVADAAEQTPNEGGGIPFIRRVRVDDIGVTDVRIDAAIAGEAVTFEASGGLDVFLRDFPRSRIALDVLRDGDAFAALHIGGETLDIQLDDADALIMRLVGVEDAKSIRVMGVGVEDGSGIWRGHLDAFVGDIVAAKADIQQLGRGRFAIVGSVDLANQPERQIRGRIDSDRLAEDMHIDVQYGPDILVSGHVRRREMVVGFRDLAVVTPYAHVSGRGRYDAGTGALRANMRLRAPQDLAGYAEGASGMAVASVRVRGTTAPLMLRAEIDGQIEDFSYSQEIVQGIIGAQPQLQALVHVDGAQGVQLTSARLSGQRLVVKAAGWLRDFNTFDMDASASAALPRPLDGRVDMVAGIRGDISAPVAEGTIGGRYGDMTLKAAYAFTDMVLRLSDIEGAGAGAIVRGRGDINVAEGVSDLRLRVSQGDGAPIALDVRSDAWTKLEADVRMSGAVNADIGIGLDATASPLVVNVRRANVTTSDTHFTLRGPFDVTYGADGRVVFEGASLGVMGGVVNASGDILVQGLSGEMRADFSGISLAAGRVQVGGEAHVRMADGAADLQAVVRQSAGHVLNVNARTAMRAGASLSGRVQGDIDIAVLQAVPALDGHAVSGRMGADVALSGTNTAPALSGRVTLRDGTYSNVVYGTRLERIVADVLFDGQALRLDNATATDGKRGHLRVGGSGNLRDGTFDVDVQATQMHLASTDRLAVTVTGDTQVSIGQEVDSVRGDIHIDSAEVYMRDMLGTRDPFKGYDVIDARDDADDIAPPRKPMALDISVRGDQGLFVRSPGLESEWDVRLHVGGYAAEPDVRGSVSVLRGRYEFVDLLAQLTPNSKVTFAAGAPATNPDLGVQGEIHGNGHVALLKVEGTAQQPAVSITSPGGLPADEALALVMFGEPKDRLTGAQLIRVARVLAALSGRGGGFDPMNALRRNMGLDTLSVGMGDDGGASLSAGKYVADGVYVSVEQGTTPSSSAVKTEIDLTDRISVETRVSPADNKVGVQWKRDY